MGEPEYSKHPIAHRFRGFLPVVVDVETGGFDCERDALLEIAVVRLDCDADGRWHPVETLACQVEPFPGANLDPKALEFTGIRPDSPLRGAIPEREALTQVFTPVRAQLRETGCTRAVLVGHNAFFDHSFVKAAVQRTRYRHNPFHQFTTLDTAALAGLAYGQTVLARAVVEAGLEWDPAEAHSAIYDAEMTAELFCRIVNRWDERVGAPRAPA